jgi:tetratricopeptide (TPR) repeat protein
MAPESLNAEATLREGAAKILRENPQHVPSLLTMARLAQEAGDSSTVLDYLNRYLEGGGERSEEVAWMEYKAATQISDHERAVRIGSELLKAHSQDLELLVSMAEHYAGLQHYEHALIYLHKARELDPENRDVMKLTRQYDEAHRRARMQELKSYLEQNPSDFARHEELGDLFFDFGELNQAIVHYQRAALGNATATVARAKLGYTLTVKEMYSEAEELFNEVQLTISQPVEELARLKALFYNTAQLLEKEDQFVRALHLYKRIFRIDAGYRDVVSRIERLQRLEKKR